MSNISVTNVGICIYCEADHDLTDEHAIPFALNGSRILKKASCLSCNAITTRFERSILRKNMLAVRIVLGLPTRKKKNRPDKLPLIFIRGSSRSEELVPVEDAIPAFVFPELGPPLSRREVGHLLGLQAGEFQAKAHLVRDRVSDEHVRNVLKKYSADSVETTWEIDHDDFLRLIAKIGMCEAIAFYGYRQFERFYVRKAILGSDRPEYWVGGDGRYDIFSMGGFEDSTHVVAAVRPRGFQEVWIRVKLWNLSLTPEYTVVVGRLRRNYARFLDAHDLVC